MQRHVVVVNGPPRAGKDTTIHLMTNHLMERGFVVGAFSSIDPVKRMLASAGIDTSAKTPEDRNLLASVGDAVEAHSQAKTTACVDEARKLLLGQPKAVLFLHTREPAIIARVRDRLVDFARFSTIFVENPRQAHEATNAADANVRDFPYDRTILNDGDLDDLDLKAERAVIDLLRN